METDAQKELELEVLAHRYLYFILNVPVISDFQFDLLQMEAQAVLPKGSPVYQMASVLSSNYPTDAVSRACDLLMMGAESCSK